MSLRAKQAVDRRNKMLDAAESLVRETRGTDFSMRALSLAAEVGPTTPYNFFGSKEGLLFELMNRTLKPFENEALVFSSEDPLEQAVQAAENAVRIIVRDADYLRPLYQTLLSLSDPVNRPKYLNSAVVFYRKALNGAVEHKLLSSEHERTSLAWSLLAHLVGVLYLWLHENINDDMFRAHVVSGFVHLLLPLADGKSLKKLQKRRNELSKELSSYYSRTRVYGLKVKAEPQCL